MSWRDAPLYVEVHDVARWLLERAADWPQLGEPHLGRLVAASACDLAVAVSLALSFPAPRRRYLEAADEAMVRLRELLRLAAERGVLAAGGRRYVAGRLQIAGRMLGGWRNRLERKASQEQQAGTGMIVRGGGPPAARGA